MIRRLSLRAALAVISICLYAFAYQTSSVHAQDLAGGASRTDLSGGAGSGGAVRTPRRPKVRNTAASTGVRVIERTKTVVLTPKTGTLSVAAEPGASILVEPLKGGEAKEGEIAKDEKQFIFNKLEPGRYRVAAEMDGYTEDEKEIIVRANQTIPVSLNLRPVTYSVTITANIPTGEVRYATVAPSKDQSGEVKYNVTGETRVVQIQNGKAVLPNLRAGTYGIDVRTDLVEYQTLLASFTLPGKTDYPVQLPKRLSTKTYSAAWVSLDGWEAPAGWRVGSRKLTVSGRGVALPRDDAARYYADFRLFSNIKMLNGVAASFAVRAADSQNYYLIQITGAKADEPYVLRGFIVKNGNAQRFGSAIPVDAYANTLKTNQFFNISMEATDNKFKVSITDSETGEEFPLGTLEDPNRNFRIGAAGIAIRDNEQNEIERFVVCTAESPDCRKG